MAKQTFIIEIDDVDILILKHELLDIQVWLDEAIVGKINSTWKRFRAEWTTKLIDDPVVASIPATKAELVNTAMLRADYKDRLAKDIEQNLGSEESK